MVECCAGEDRDGGGLKQRESIGALYLIVNIMYNHENKFIGKILKLHWGTGRFRRFTFTFVPFEVLLFFFHKN